MGDAAWYIWIVVAFGVGSLLVSFTKVFLASDMSLPDLNTEDAPPVGSQEFLETIALTVDADVVEGGTAELLHNGEGFFPRFLEDVRAARKTVHVMTYIWEPHECTRSVFEALTQAAARGVDVRVMADGVGGWRLPRSLIRTFEEAGGKFQWFSPVFSPHVININQRNHRRAFVIDGRVAYTGGIAMAEHWTGDAQTAGHWRDIMLRLTGPPVVTVQEFFIGLWANIRGELPFGEGLTPRAGERAGGDGPSDEGERPLGEAAVRAEDCETFRHLGVSHTPSIHVQPLRQLFWFSMRAATERIWINTAYFAPDGVIRQVMRDAAKAGRDVRLLTPSEKTDARYVRAFAHRYYEELMKAGVRVFEYQPTMLHSKYLVVDGRWVVTGSANLDIRSFQLNQECVMGFDCRELAAKFEETFERDLRDAREFDLETWRKRGLRAKAMETLVLPIWHQI